MCAFVPRIHQWASLALYNSTSLGGPARQIKIKINARCPLARPAELQRRVPLTAYAHWPYPVAAGCLYIHPDPSQHVPTYTWSIINSSINQPIIIGITITPAKLFLSAFSFLSPGSGGPGGVPLSHPM